MTAQIVSWHVQLTFFLVLILISCKNFDHTSRTQHCNKCQYLAVSNSVLGQKFITSCCLSSGAEMRPGTTLRTGAIEMELPAVSTSVNGSCLLLPGGAAARCTALHPPSSPIQAAVCQLIIPADFWTPTGKFWIALAEMPLEITNNLMGQRMEPSTVKPEMCLGAVWFTRIGMAFLIFCSPPLNASSVKCWIHLVMLYF